MMLKISTNMRSSRAFTRSKCTRIHCNSEADPSESIPTQIQKRYQRLHKSRTAVMIAIMVLSVAVIGMDNVMDGTDKYSPSTKNITIPNISTKIPEKAIVENISPRTNIADGRHAERKDRAHIRSVWRYKRDVWNEGKRIESNFYNVMSGATAGILPFTHWATRHVVKAGQGVRNFSMRWKCSECGTKYTREEADPNKLGGVELVSDCLPCGEQFGNGVLAGWETQIVDDAFNKEKETMFCTGTRVYWRTDKPDKVTRDSKINLRVCNGALERNDGAKQKAKELNIYSRVGNRWLCSNKECGHTYSKQQARICVGGANCTSPGYNVKTCTMGQGLCPMNGKRLIESWKHPNSISRKPANYLTVTVEVQFQNFTCKCGETGTLVRNDKVLKAIAKAFKNIPEAIKNAAVKAAKGIATGVKKGNPYQKIGNRWLCSNKKCGHTYSKQEARICVGGANCKSSRYVPRGSNRERVPNCTDPACNSIGTRLIWSYKHPLKIDGKPENYVALTVEQQFKNYTCECGKKGSLVRNNKITRALVNAAKATGRAIKKLGKELWKGVKFVPELASKTNRDHWLCDDRDCGNTFSEADAANLLHQKVITCNDHGVFTCTCQKAVLIRNDRKKKALWSFWRIFNRTGCTKWICGVCREVFSDKDYNAKQKRCCDEALQRNECFFKNLPRGPTFVVGQRVRMHGLKVSQHFNDQFGRISQEQDKDVKMGVWTVDLDEPGPNFNDAKKNFHFRNLEVSAHDIPAMKFSDTCSLPKRTTKRTGYEEEKLGEESPRSTRPTAPPMERKGKWTRRLIAAEKRAETRQDL